MLVGTLVWRFLASIFNNISEMIAWERWEGTIEYTFMAPVHRFNQMLGQTIFAIVYSLVFTVVIGVVVAAFFDLDFADADFTAATVILLVGQPVVRRHRRGGVHPAAALPGRGAQMISCRRSSCSCRASTTRSACCRAGCKLAKISPATYVLEGMRAALLPDTATADPLSYVWPC